MQSRVPYFFFLAAVCVGLADTLYLSLTVLFDTVPVCGPLHGCAIVAASAYSKLFGIPLAFLGVLYYTGGTLLSGFLQTSSRVRFIATLYGFVGVSMSLWFTYVQVVYVQALCVYCVISAAATCVLCAAAILMYRQQNKPNTNTSDA